jgi:hypothetical protein
MSHDRTTTETIRVEQNHDLEDDPHRYKHGLHEFSCRYKQPQAPRISIAGGPSLMRRNCWASD